MATLKDSIVENFIARLREAKELDEATIEALRLLLASGAKIKADDIIKVFTARDEVK